MCMLFSDCIKWLYIFYRLKSIIFKYMFYFLNLFIFNLCIKFLKIVNGELLDWVWDFGNID